MTQCKKGGSQLCGFGRNNKAVTGVVLHALLNPPLWLSKKIWKKGSERAVHHAAQVNSWTVEYLAGRKYEAQLAFKRKSSPGASGRSQPARPWSAARQEPCVKAEGLCHCVQMFLPLCLLPQNTRTHADTLHTMHNPWCEDDLTHRADAIQQYQDTFRHVHTVCTTTSLS